MATLPFKGLAIKGGGVAGVAYLGAIKRWVASGRDFNQFTVFAGSSAGSLLATILALRSPLDFLEKKLRSADFSKFLDTSIISKFKDIAAVVEHYGWNSGDGLEKWFGDVVGELTGNRELTFIQAYQRYGTHLIITTTDVLYPECQLVVMDWKSHPDTTLHSAVRKSCSIPLFFQAVTGETGHIFIDGGVVLNYPMELLYDAGLSKEECMGLYLTTPKKIGSTTNRPVRSYPEFVESIVGTWMDAMMGQHVHADDWTRTCSIPTNLKATDFSASKEKQDAAIKQGWDAMDKFISATLAGNTSPESPEDDKDLRIRELEEKLQSTLRELDEANETIQSYLD
jgi:NTE family protein